MATAGRDNINADGPLQANRPGPTPQIYAHTVVQHAQRTHDATLFPGQNYKALADFLSRPYGQLLGLPPPTFANEDNKTFLYLCHFAPGSAPSYTSYSASPASMEKFLRREPLSAGSSQILFIRGFAKPEWLNLFGSLFRVDPEHFRRHLNFMMSNEYFDIPGLPSASQNLVKIPLVTIGSRSSNGLVQSGSVDLDRRNAGLALSSFLHQVCQTGHDGQSIVRELNVHNEKYHSVEQEISISVQVKSGGWIAIAWIDCGQDDLEARLCEWLRSSRTGSYLPHHAFLPVYQCREKIAMRSSDNNTQSTSPRRSAGVNNRPLRNADSFQSASLLHRQYGLNLHRDIMRTDAFYALSDLFNFSACSESQFLNLVSSLIEQEQDPPLEKMQISLANLQYSKNLLETHIEKQQSLYKFISDRTSIPWPRATDEEHIKIVDAHAERLLKDFSHLISRARGLRAQAMDLMTLLMNKAMLAEAQRGIAQAEGVARLTLLAFLFVPLSFTTSLFGMNFTQLADSEGPKLSIYVWAVVSVPLFLASLGFLFWNTVVKRFDFARRWLGFTGRGEGAMHGAYAG